METKKPKTKIHHEVYTQMDETWFMYEIDHKDVNWSYG
jgi:hypothetical protein